jgi:hypothetical protein
VKKSPDADKFAEIGGVIGRAMNLKDFGSGNSSASLADLKPLQDNLWYYLRISNIQTPSAMPKAPRSSTRLWEGAKTWV